jgi:hypothetical protein
LLLLLSANQMKKLQCTEERKRVVTRTASASSFRIFTVCALLPRDLMQFCDVAFRQLLHMLLLLLVESKRPRCATAALVMHRKL